MNEIQNEKYTNLEKQLIVTTNKARGNLCMGVHSLQEVSYKSFCNRVSEHLLYEESNGIGGCEKTTLSQERLCMKRNLMMLKG